MVQDVCVDKADKVLIGVSPLDGQEKCPRHRDLRVGENLPYHKHDWANLPVRPRLPAGYQRSDSFPIETRLLGTAVVQTFDFGDDGRTFGQFDEGNGDGGQVVVFSARSAAFGLTEDAGAGLQFFYGPQCDAVQPGRRIFDSWIVVDRSFSLGRPGETLARLDRNLSTCPGALNYAYTRWKAKQVSFQTRSAGKEGRQTLTTLISDHFGGKSLIDAGHLERFYFRRELGLTRWERWQNLAKQERPNDRDSALKFTATGRCEHLEEQPAPSGGGEWVMVDCRQWTNIVLSAAPQGDPPTFWVDNLRERPETHELFGR